MASAIDDYGISYYFRGNVQNNYVVFADMCWRIVRVTGDGSIKLVLYNYKRTANCAETGDDLAVVNTDFGTSSKKTTFGESGGNNAYIGFMYGSASGDTYAETHANINKSTILNNLETWYASYLQTYSNRLADTIWCNDKSTTGDGIGTSTSASNYGAYNRAESGLPSLICPDDNEDEELSKFTVNDTINGNGALDYKIGLLTIDEIVYAGLKWNTTNSNSNYLKDNVGSSSYWWSLSPEQFSGSIITIWMSSGSGSVGGAGGLYSGALRPAISLLNSTTISGGTGTASDPFVVS